MALKARAENKTLAARLAEIEALLAQSDKKSSKKAASDS
jgi:BMFP domain-containing protein YqiC